MRTDLRNIGIFAHVDAGKTTLTEQMLRHSGQIRQAGSVDAGTAHTDRMDIERRRGISVRSTCAQLDWKGVRINLIDTPGHADFAAEVERSLWALDGAVLIISAAEGIQPQALVLFAAFLRAQLPVLLFINKTDREGVDVPALVADARRSLSTRVVDPSDSDQVMALLAEDDEQALEAYLQGQVYPQGLLFSALAEKTRAGLSYPVWHGSALKDEGVPALLDAIVEYLPGPAGSPEAPVSGVVFAIEQDKTLGRAAHVRMFSGTLHNRDTVSLETDRPSFSEEEGQREAKITQVRTIPLEGRGEDLGVLAAGEIGALYGLGDVRVGQVLGDASLLPRRIASGEIGTPLLMVKVLPEDVSQQAALRQALELLAAEDPLLGVESYGGALHIRVMGTVQLEVLSEWLQARFGLTVTFGPPHVIYRETIAQSAVGFFAYTMPKPCWAVIKFQIEPLSRGSGIKYSSVVPAREIMPRYQHQVEQALPLALRQGMLGWQVEDVRITLIGGEHHLIHTHPLDFILATPVALMDGLQRAGTVLLEPILEMRMTVPEASLGRLIHEIALMRGEVMESHLTGDMVEVMAQVPLAASVDFSVRLASITSGRGSLSVRLHSYRDLQVDDPPTCPRRGVNPLDTAKYILAARNAMGGGVFES